MAEDDDSGPDNGGKAHTFSLDQLLALRRTLPPQAKHRSFQHFKEDMRAWLAQHAGAREQRYNWRKSADVLAAREGQRAALDDLLKALKKTALALRTLTDYSPGQDRIVDKLAPEHRVPSESILSSGAHDRARDELNGIYRGMERLFKAAAGARKDLAKRGHRGREDKVHKAISDLGTIYLAASGRLPGGTKKNGGYNGPWPRFGRLACRFAWGKQDELTGHLKAVAAEMRRGHRSKSEKVPKLVPLPPFHALAAYRRQPPENTEGAG
jgi:hypothetical protein